MLNDIRWCLMKTSIIVANWRGRVNWECRCVMRVVRDLEQGTGNACCLKQHILIAEIFIVNFRGREWVFRFLTYLSNAYFFRWSYNYSICVVDSLGKRSQCISNSCMVERYEYFSKSNIKRCDISCCNCKYCCYDVVRVWASFSGGIGGRG